MMITITYHYLILELTKIKSLEFLGLLLLAIVHTHHRYINKTIQDQIEIPFFKSSKFITGITSTLAPILWNRGSTNEGTW
jgi:hypothetical protein